jgi:hypothetical protein
MRNDVIKALEELLLENKKCTKPVAYENGYNNALVDLIHKLGLGEVFEDRGDLWND